MRRGLRKFNWIKFILFLVIVFFITMLITMGITKIVKNKKAKTNEISLNETEVSEPIAVIMSEEEELKEIEENAEEVESTDKPQHVESNSPYYVRVNTSANCVTIYARGDDGEYSRPIKAMICSTGPYTPPCGKYPKNLYKITGARWEWQPLQQGVCGHYTTQIVGNILFHSVPYTEMYNPASLEWWEFDKLGTSASAGCVRLQARDAQWIYSNLPSGTYVEFYQSGDPGPLGKPGAPKISSNERCRNWDPTDGNGENPWNHEPIQTPAPESVKQPEVKENKIESNVTTNTNEEKGVEEVVSNIQENNTISQNISENTSSGQNSDPDPINENLTNNSNNENNSETTNSSSGTDENKNSE